MIQPSQERETFQCGAAANQRAGSRGPLPASRGPLPASRLGCPPPLDAPVTEAPLHPLLLPGPSPKDLDCNPFDSEENPNESSGPPNALGHLPPFSRSGGAPFRRSPALGLLPAQVEWVSVRVFRSRGGGAADWPPSTPPADWPPSPPPGGLQFWLPAAGGGRGGGGREGEGSKYVAASPGFPREIELGFKVLGF